MDKLPPYFLVAVDRKQALELQKRLFQEGYTLPDGTQTRTLDNPQMKALFVDRRSNDFGWALVSQAPQIPSVSYNEIVGSLQSMDELIAENSSLAEQIDRLQAKRLKLLEEAEELLVKVGRKQMFYQLNADRIKELLPDEIKRFKPYL